MVVKKGVDSKTTAEKKRVQKWRYGMPWHSASWCPFWDGEKWPPSKVEDMWAMKNPGCLGCIEDYTTQLYGEFTKINKPI